MSGLATEHLARLDDYLKLVAVVLTIAAALTAAFAWFTGRELEQRRTADSVKMQEQVQTAEQVADRLRRRLAPREVSAEQRRLMLAALQGSQGSVLIIHLPDPEAKLYAERVAAIISDGGWQVSFAGGSPFGATFGFILTTKDGSNLRATTGALRSALESAFGSDKVALTSQASMKEDEVRLTVGMKRME